MVYITGGTHGTVDFYKLLSNDLKDLTKDDYVIICGDSGILFRPEHRDHLINLYSYLPFSVLVVDGNHDNHHLLNALPVEEWNGGKVHRIAPSILHLMRGQVFNIDGYRFFAMGGGLSYDRLRRIPNVSWWEQEMITEEDFQEALSNLQKVDFTVDFVITHDIPASWVGAVSSSRKIIHEGFQEAPSNRFLDELLGQISFRHWFWAHYHIDVSVGSFCTGVYEKIIKLIPSVPEMMQLHNGKDLHFPMLL